MLVVNEWFQDKPKEKNYIIYGDFLLGHRLNSLFEPSAYTLLAHKYVLEEMSLCIIEPNLPGLVPKANNVVCVDLVRLSSPNIELYERFHKDYKESQVVISGAQYSVFTWLGPCKTISETDWQSNLERIPNV